MLNLKNLYLEHHAIKKAIGESKEKRSENNAEIWQVLSILEGVLDQLVQYAQLHEFEHSNQGAGHVPN